MMATLFQPNVLRKEIRALLKVVKAARVRKKYGNNFRSDSSGVKAAGETYMSKAFNQLFFQENGFLKKM